MCLVREEAGMDKEITTLSESLVDELVGAVGLPKNKLFHVLFWFLFRDLLTRFASLGMIFDRLTAKKGLPQACAWGLSHFSSRVVSRGREHIPTEGPLLIVSNHPGTFDAFIIFSQLGRKDIHVISSEIPFLDHLPHVRPYILFASRINAYRRMLAMRGAIRHLQDGTSLLYFGSGHRNSYQAVYPGAAEEIDGWLSGIDFFFHHVSNPKILPVIVSGVISPKWAHHPITWLRRKPIDSRRLAEFGQVISQLLVPRKLLLSSFISFGMPATFSELRRESSSEQVLPAVIARGKALLAEHMAWMSTHTKG
jgi:1-acyl-sn-glycerol-3-phosphate acyltransferase